MGFVVGEGERVGVDTSVRVGVGTGVGIGVGIRVGTGVWGVIVGAMDAGTVAGVVAIPCVGVGDVMGNTVGVEENPWVSELGGTTIGVTEMGLLVGTGVDVALGVVQALKRNISNNRNKVTSSFSASSTRRSLLSMRMKASKSNSGDCIMCMGYLFPFFW